MYSICYFLLIFVLALEATGFTLTSLSSNGWEAISPAPQNGAIKLHIALRQTDKGTEIEQQLLAVSDPTSEKFRQHLSPLQAIRLSAAAEHSITSVQQWLGAHAVSANLPIVGSILEVETTIGIAQKLLNTTYMVYSNGDRRVIRTDDYQLPDDIAEHIDFVTPTTMFPRAVKGESSDLGIAGAEPLNNRYQLSMINTRTNCGSNDFTTPTCVRQAYGIDYNAQPNRTTFAVYGTEAATFSPKDLGTYLSRYNKPAAVGNAKYEIVSKTISNKTGGIGAQFETALDTQTLMGLAWPARGILYENGGVFGPDPGHVYDNFVQFLQELIVNKTAPSVVSFSESMPEDMVDANYARRLCNMMAQVGARGVTLLFSSGDNGANGDQPTGEHLKIFEPEFPASCPWVTSVGGTTDLESETAATKSTIGLASRLSYTASGGGFSNLFSRPTYQSTAVGKYISKHISRSYYTVPGFNGSGRGIPDISAFSTNFPTVVDFFSIPVGGTSASTPLWAAIVTLLNDYETSKGQPHLGFINPWLYSLTSGLKDITTGGNNAGSCYWIAGCHLPETLGYNVTAGWDPVTGLGSPQFKELQKVLDGIH